MNRNGTAGSETEGSRMSFPGIKLGEAPIGRLHLQLEDAASIEARFPAPFTSSSSSGRSCRLTLHLLAPQRLASPVKHAAKDPRGERTQ